MAENSKVVINLATGLDDGERVTVAFLVAGAALEQGKQVEMFLTKEAVRLARRRAARVPDLLQREEARRRPARSQRPPRRRDAALGMDRRRRYGLQLLMAVEVHIAVDLLKREIKKTYASVSQEPEKDCVFP